MFSEYLTEKPAHQQTYRQTPKLQQSLFGTALGVGRDLHTPRFGGSEP